MLLESPIPEGEREGEAYMDMVGKIAGGIILGFLGLYLVFNHLFEVNSYRQDDNARADDSTGNCRIPRQVGPNRWRLAGTTYTMDVGPRDGNDVLCGDGRTAHWEVR